MSVQVKEIGLKDVELVAQPIRLPNGRVVPNRLSKVGADYIALKSMSVSSILIANCPRRPGSAQ
jgi:hypothetical protein